LSLSAACGQKIHNLAGPAAFLAPGSECELNIDHNLREELVAYMNKVFAEIAAKESGAIGDTKKIDPAVAARNMAAIKLHNLVKLYERIQGYIFRLMATDSVPKVSPCACVVGCLCA
jgi:hypothetical protein